MSWRPGRSSTTSSSEISAPRRGRGQGTCGSSSGRWDNLGANGVKCWWRVDVSFIFPTHTKRQGDSWHIESSYSSNPTIFQSPTWAHRSTSLSSSEPPQLSTHGICLREARRRSHLAMVLGAWSRLHNLYSLPCNLWWFVISCPDCRAPAAAASTRHSPVSSPLSLSPVELQTIHRFSQSRRRPLLRPSPGWKTLYTWNWYENTKVVRDGVG